MGLTVKQECPQCGAPVQMDEADHILMCPYCNVKSFLFAPRYYRFMLPHKTVNRKIFYIPYLRFKGSVYYCKNLEIKYRIVDITNVGVPLEGVPVSLGLRPQAMKIRFIVPDTDGLFLKFVIKPTEIIERAGRLGSIEKSGRPFYRAYIGETLSLIYLPVYVENNGLFDAVLKRPICKLPEDTVFFKYAGRMSGWKLTCVPTLCPRCGWNLEGDSDSIVLTCKNCDTAWEVLKGKFVRVQTRWIKREDNKAVYLPFWKTSAAANAKEVSVNSFADFVRLTNQPRIIKEEWNSQTMAFWSPAFKIRPKIFLNISRQLTLSQPLLGMKKGIPRKNVCSVTLPWNESVQSIKLTLASSAVSKKNVLPLLPRIRIVPKDSTLVYLPFEDTGYELIQPDINISINKKAMSFGKHL